MLKHADKDGFVSGRLALKASRSAALTNEKVKRYYGGEITTRPLRFQVLGAQTAHPQVEARNGPIDPQGEIVGQLSDEAGQPVAGVTIASAAHQAIAADVAATAIDAEDTAATVDAEAAAQQLAADKVTLAKASAELEKLVASREQARLAGGDTDRLDVDIAVQRVRVAHLKLRIADEENRKRPGSTPDEAMLALKRETLVRWGKPVGGVQVGLERVSIRDTFTAGEAVEFRRRVRNVSAELLETTLRFRPAAAGKAELFSDGRFTVGAVEPKDESVAIKLPPGADQPIVGSEFLIETRTCSRAGTLSKLTITFGLAIRRTQNGQWRLRRRTGDISPRTCRWPSMSSRPTPR